ncbi:MAG: hypothetical protein KIH69_019565 [Anaerolineae bacterium]|nr:hypothetical protein [Anaerolineae bacterium]
MLNRAGVGEVGEDFFEESVVGVMGIVAGCVRHEGSIAGVGKIVHLLK